jgi:hypothetical protein
MGKEKERMVCLFSSGGVRERGEEEEAPCWGRKEGDKMPLLMLA